MPAEQIVRRTKRLALRELSFGDIDPLMEIFTDPVAMRFFPNTRNRQQTEAWIQRNLDRYQRFGHGFWAVTHAEELIGYCGLIDQPVDGILEFEIGYGIKRKLWQQGFAGEAAAATRDLSFGKHGRSRVISLIDPDNIGSIGVAQSIGMTFERQTYIWERSTSVYSLSRADHFKAKR